jgi:hypothetical protein
LHLTKIEGTQVTAIFSGSFAAMRFLAIFLAVYVNPLFTMLFSFVLCAGSGIALVFAAEKSIAVLQACFGQQNVDRMIYLVDSSKIEIYKICHHVHVITYYINN